MTPAGQNSLASSACYFNSLQQHLGLGSLLIWMTMTGLLQGMQAHLPMAHDQRREQKSKQ